jgi:RimJ/RimL family protein N-acetyltransferase
MDSRLPTLETERLRLRWLEERDVDALHQVFADPAVTRYWSAPPLVDSAAARALLQEIRDYFKRGNLYQWGIALADTDQVIGTVTLAWIDREHRRSEVGFALAKSAWGQGYATEAVARLIGHAFDDLELHRLGADVDPRNEPSIKLLERLGFQREGLLRERYHLAGEIQDSLILGLLRSEWGARRPDEPEGRGLG